MRDCAHGLREPFLIMRVGCRGRKKKELDMFISDIVEYNSILKAGFIRAAPSQPVTPANNPDFKETKHEIPSFNAVRCSAVALSVGVRAEPQHAQDTGAEVQRAGLVRHPENAGGNMGRFGNGGSAPTRHEGRYL